MAQKKQRFLLIAHLDVELGAEGSTKRQIMDGTTTLVRVDVQVHCSEDGATHTHYGVAMNDKYDDTSAVLGGFDKVQGIKDAMAQVLQQSRNARL